MSDTPYLYPLDTTGSAKSNLITNEHHALTPPAMADFHFIVPRCAPFFEKNFKIFDNETGRELVLGVDYALTHRFIDASRSIGRAIYGSVLFYDKERKGSVKLSYQTLGGEWTINESEIIRIIEQKSLNPRVISWEQVAEVPKQFPVIDHDWRIDDMVGAKELVAAVEKIAQRILETADIRELVRAHIEGLETNPHGTTKDDLELDKVENWPPATLAEARGGQGSENYMSATLVRAALESYTSEKFYTQTELDDRLGDMEARLRALENS